MRKYNYSFELENQLIMFISALDDIIVKRYNRDRIEEDKIKVRFVYAPKQRVLLDLLDKAQNIQLPVIAVSNGGITRDPSRVFNKIQGSYASSPDPRYAKNVAQPVPIDITINLSILTRYQQDFDQIVSNIFAFTDPYIIISWKIPSMPDYEIRSQAIWNGNINTTYPTDLNATQVARVQGDTSFTFKGWLFKSSLDKDDSKIFTVTTDMSNIAGLTTQYSIDQLNPLTTDRAVLSAQPQPRAINPYYTTVSSSDTFALYGKSFFNITNVYLSGNRIFNSTFYNPFSAVPRLSAAYPGFYGTRLLSSAFISNNEDVVTFTMPSASLPGKVDIILQNEAGYGSLIKYGFRTTFNPYLTSMSEYSAFTNYKSPFLSGIEVRPIS
jgi:hypothetical protein